MAAGTDQSAKQLYEFGPFRVDAEKEILLRGDQAVPLAPKTFQVLLVLMRNKKEVVTKDELMRAVWPDTFVEEANLSRNIFLLRKALGESPQDHQYIVTVPGRGYRFAEDVQIVPDQELNIVAASHAKVQVEIKESNLWRWLVAAGVLLALAVGSVGFFFLHHRTALTAKDTVVLADFANSTGDPVFDDALRQGLAVQLEQSPLLRIVSDQQIQQTLKMMGQNRDAKLTPEIARELCQRTASSAVLDGAIAQIGTPYILTVKAVSCANGETLASTVVQASDKNHVLDALGKTATEIRKKLGESHPCISE
jgi:DNA-binding winged helix-turn-helix (wHTH) protein